MNGPPAEAYALVALSAAPLHDGVAAAPSSAAPVERRCPLCAHPVRLPDRPDSRCPACQSPLTVLPELATRAHDLLGRRGAVRRDQSHVALLHVGWPSQPVAVRWRDLSLSGLSLYAPLPLAAGQRLRLIDSALEGVAEVVDCRPQGRLHVVHARLLTALLLRSTGVFVSAQA